MFRKRRDGVMPQIVEAQSTRDPVHFDICASPWSLALSPRSGEISEPSLSIYARNSARGLRRNRVLFRNPIN
jgi:hypothetical protein